MTPQTSEAMLHAKSQVRAHHSLILQSIAARINARLPAEIDSCCRLVRRVWTDSSRCGHIDLKGSRLFRDPFCFLLHLQSYRPHLWIDIPAVSNCNEDSGRGVRNDFSICPFARHERAERKQLTMRETLLTCGILASLTYIGTDLVAGIRNPGYSFTDQAVSELFAIGAPISHIVVPLFTLSSVLVGAFAFGVWAFGGSSRLMQWLSVMFLGDAVNSLVLEKKPVCCRLLLSEFRCAPPLTIKRYHERSERGDLSPPKVNIRTCTSLRTAKHAAGSPGFGSGRKYCWTAQPKGSPGRSYWSD